MMSSPLVVHVPVKLFDAVVMCLHSQEKSWERYLKKFPNAEWAMLELESVSKLREQVEDCKK